ncbi:formimidoylglutamate deiminase [Hyphobacterium sp.]|uniref:formimidoylglutamate deiminase n=1 Tax=Hyphobacterium sp. TaxID=2004662 RepID=UPI003BAC2C91
MRKLYAASALLPEGWMNDVQISIDAKGRIKSVQADTPPASDAERYGVLLPALCNLHSHAFQRALAGLTQVRGTGNDDFWSWRETMYAFLPKLGPDEVNAIAALLYAELAESGFAAVAEFHYLHHQPDGRPYNDVAEMAGRIAAAANETGLGLTLLPVAYVRSGFGGAPITEAQTRFSNRANVLLKLRDACKRHLDRSDDVLGLAPHSLRAVTPEDLETLLNGAPEGPFHIHIAEQQKEVSDCLNWSGQRPVEWLLDHANVNEKWCLVHATHMTEAETRALSDTNAVAGICPTTEADLGDGAFNGVQWQSLRGRWGIGTDSHVRTDAAEELRLYEWGQRLTHQKRTLLTVPGGSTGRSLYENALYGGAQALDRDSGAIVSGNFADLMAIDRNHPSLAGKAGDALLDGWIFAGGGSCISDVWSAGRHIVRDGRHVIRERVVQRYNEVMTRLLT